MYPDYQVQATTTAHPGQLDTILTSITDAGCTLPKSVAEAWQTARDRHEHIDKTEAELYDSGGLFKEVGARLAEGEATAEDVRAALLVKTLTTKNTDPHAPDKIIFTGARTAIDQRLRLEMARHGDDWITQTMRPVVDTLVTELIAADIPAYPIDTRDGQQVLEPLANSDAVREPWAKLRALWDAAQELRKVRVIPSTMERQDAYEWAGDITVRDGLARTFTMFTYLARNGHQPGIYTQAEADAHLDAAGIVRGDKATRELRQRQMDQARRIADLFETKR